MNDSKSFKKRNKGDNATKALRNAAIEAKAIEGLNNQEIAQQTGLTPQHVSKILNSSEIKAKVKEAESRVAGMIDDALTTLHEAIKMGAIDPTNSLKAALAVLKNYGAIKDNVNVNLSLPKPLVIERRNGTQVILGTEADKDEDQS